MIPLFVKRRNYLSRTVKSNAVDPQRWSDNKGENLI